MRFFYLWLCRHGLSHFECDLFTSRPKEVIRALMVFICLFWFTVVVVLAADRYVSPSGTNNPPYINWADAATNIQWAVDVATNGDTVWVTNGNYRLTNEIWFKSSTLSTNVRLKSVNGRDVTSICGNYIAGVSPYSNRCIYISNSYITVDGFTVSNGYALGINNGLGGGIYATTTDGKILNCTIKSNYAEYRAGGVCLASSSISNCIVEDNIAGWKEGGGIGTPNSGGSATVDNCIIRRNLGNGIGKMNSDALLTIRNCVIAHNYANYLGGGYSGLGVMCNHNTTVENCTIVSNYFTSTAETLRNGGGIGLRGSGTNIVIRNCIIYSNSATYGENWYTNGSTSIFFYNCCTTPTNDLPGSGNITNWPMFVDYGATNYRLAANSPCVNTGTNQDWMTNSVDFDGRIRIRYGTVDMGAYENIHEGMVYKLR